MCSVGVGGKRAKNGPKLAASSGDRCELSRPALYSLRQHWRALGGIWVAGDKAWSLPAGARAVVEEIVACPTAAAAAATAARVAPIQSRDGWEMQGFEDFDYVDNM